MTLHSIPSLLLVSTVLMFGQVPPTHIGKHQINETLQVWSEQQISPHQLDESVSDWLNLNQLDLNDICAKHSRNDTTADYKAVCKRLTAIQNKGAGEFFTTSDTGQKVGWRFAGGKVVDYAFGQQWHSTFATKDKILTIANNREYDWRFAGGRLSEVHITPNYFAQRQQDRVLSYKEEVDFLVQTLGKPSNVKTNPYHNGFGAQWETTSVFWNMPDGTEVVAFESSEFDKQGKLLAIIFLSKDAVERQAQQPSATNPYKP
jgi:hypothetical protein